MQRNEKTKALRRSYPRSRRLPTAREHEGPRRREECLRYLPGALEGAGQGWRLASSADQRTSARESGGVGAGAGAGPASCIVFGRMGFRMQPTRHAATEPNGVEANREMSRRATRGSHPTGHPNERYDRPGRAVGSMRLERQRESEREK